jgi:hypothetical protein
MYRSILALALVMNLSIPYTSFSEKDNNEAFNQKTPKPKNQLESIPLDWAPRPARDLLSFSAPRKEYQHHNIVKVVECA